MIAYIEGRLAEQLEHSVLVITGGGVGYEVNLPAHTLQHLPERGAVFRCYTSLIVREDAQELYGFETWEERRTFDTLLTLNKVGARTACAILSQFRPDDLRRLVLGDDPTPLTRVSGIGKKTAQQVFLELKYKFKADSASLNSAPFAEAPSGGGMLADVLAGLRQMGFPEEEVLPVVQRVLKADPGLDMPGTLHAALKLLGRARLGD